MIRNPNTDARIGLFAAAMSLIAIVSLISFVLYNDLIPLRIVVLMITASFISTYFLIKIGDWVKKL